jgi:hypothetical protein
MIPPLTMSWRILIYILPLNLNTKRKADYLFLLTSFNHIRFKGKAQADRESAAYVEYVSIYRRPATQPLGLRWGFETTYRQKKHTGMRIAIKASDKMRFPQLRYHPSLIKTQLNPKRR